MKTSAKSDKQELLFYVQQAQSLEGEITIPLLISELRVGHQKASLIFEQLKKIPGIELAITPEPEESPEIHVPHTSVVKSESLEPEFDPTEFAKDEELAESVKSIELAVVEAATAPFKPGEALSYVLTKFDLGDGFVQLAAKEGETVTDEELARSIPALFVLDGWNKWATGDLVRELDKRNQGDAVTQICAMANRSCKTLRKWATVAERVPVRLRDHSLDFTQFQEIAEARYSKDEVEQAKAIEELIVEAKKEGYNVEQTREAVLQRQGKSTPPTPPPAQKKHGRFIVIDTQNCPMSYSTDQLPDNSDNCFIVDTENGDLSCGGCSAGVPVWQPLTFRKLEAAVTETVEE